MKKRRSRTVRCLESNYSQMLPDGMFDERMIVEVKYSYSVRYMTPKKAIAKKKMLY